MFIEKKKKKETILRVHLLQCIVQNNLCENLLTHRQFLEKCPPQITEQIS